MYPLMAETWAGIVRVSFVGTRGGDSFHADSEQVAAMEAYAARHGARVEFMEPELDVSGGLPIEERPSLLAAIEGVEQGRYHGVVVAYLSRLTRSHSGRAIWDRVEAAGGHIHCVREGIDTSTPAGRYVRDMHLATAVMEREEHVERFAHRKAVAVAAGIWSARVVPRGYRKDSKTRRLVPDEEWAPKVRQAFVDRASGTAVSTLAARLGMTESGVRGLLQNRVYLGEVKHASYVNPAGHPPLITQAQFDAVQGDRVAQPARGVRHDPGLLGGLVRCSNCGHRLVRDLSHPGGAIYHCKKRHSGAVCPRGASIQVRKLDEHVEAVVVPLLEARVFGSGTRLAADGAALDRAVSEAEEELAAYQVATSARNPGYAAGLQVREDALAEARAAKRQAEAAAPLSVVSANAGSAAEFWERLSIPGRRQILGGLLEVVVVAPAGRRGRWGDVQDRVRLIAGGASYEVPRRRGEVPMGIQPMEWPDLEDPRVFRLGG